ncbi:hypothetical protein ACFQ44_00155 [Levilactobacillus lanxiensis]|uniref:Uncharacterized protein n=1 Tax=Levilactobacillus lanxiensis TaxID=2799568 RepID=A0ABW4D0A0_9LACO|nr:hypothetical protein [Levilactobacillus lanxiensis]
MTQEAALKLLAANGLAHTPASLARLLADGRVHGTSDAIDGESLKAYITNYQDFQHNRNSALFRGPLL